MSSLFINLLLKTSHYLHKKVLNEKISKWAHLSFYHKRFWRYLHLKFENKVIFLGRFPPYEIPESEDKISNFCVFKMVFKYLFCNTSRTAWLKELMEPILNRKFKTPYVKIIKFDNFEKLGHWGPVSQSPPNTPNTLKQV